LGFTGSLLGGMLGWAVGGPIGAVIGSLVGGGIGSARRPPQIGGRPVSDGPSAAIALVVLMAAVTKADRRVTRGEVEYVKQFLVRSFGRNNAADLMQIYKQALQKNLDIDGITAQVRSALDRPGRVQLVHVLFGLVTTDGTDPTEIRLVQDVARKLGVSEEEIRSLSAMFWTDTDHAYQVLGAAKGDSMEVIKKKYRELAKKYHPDRVSHLGEEFRDLANQKFKAIQEAYDTIKEERKS